MSAQTRFLIALRDAYPERFEPPEAEEPLFRLADGPLYRSEVQAILQLAAEEVGVDRTRYAVRSLRIGGACAFCHT